ncbi:anti-sigma factor [Duganella sp. BJB488]|uniref:cupin domain-containing protein n=1 Tax=unclassified Duganella TaxID=2636909 RepID=UPI000E34E622|nr:MULTISPECIES: cupin domain-containing protein [unclassified Duganella]NVD70484.1 cupin domain-containing protein [Duganella sp. BJB1802]RFP24204.1 anti-sigma factor [Duganella sp. BJB489]RFP26565.1 anti-sigma factor [Duganella sp. BJB488]RFP34702.1 anti-sigma factor [Duganella sp. BJB480]
MLINADFSRPVAMAPHQYQWVASPQDGVERVMLDRVGAEQARATSIVRYAPHSSFPRHQHPGGEEILVLDGTFSEGGLDYPAGWYLRNPPGSSHQPSSGEGAIIFVKLRQMSTPEQPYVRIDTCDPTSWRVEQGREICPLFSDASEQVSLQRLAPHGALLADAEGGLELLVLEGDVVAQQQTYAPRSWMRLPAGALTAIVAGEQGATVYLKVRHLANMRLKG